jgi:uncharacterized protein (DUF1697 family)
MDTLVVFLKGVNVGGHRTFRPSLLAKQLRRYDVVNIGAAGTFVVRRRISRARLRAELIRRLPFDAHVMMCSGRDILRLVSRDPFAGQPSGSAILQFVGVLARRPRASSKVPLNVPSDGEWCVTVLVRHDRFVVGLCRRQMKAIGYLGQLEKLLGVPVTTRSWSTISTIARLLKNAG